MWSRLCRSARVVVGQRQRPVRQPALRALTTSASSATSSASASGRPVSVRVNGIDYRVPSPGRPVVGICMDGSSHDYFESASKAGLMPHWQRIVGLGPHSTDADFTARFREATSTSTSSPTAAGAGSGSARGHHALCSGAMPTFTNPNNVSIMTGVSPAAHGITGNYYFDAESGAEVTMTSPALIRADSLFAALHAAGTKLTVLTAKEKLRAMLGTGLPGTHYTAAREDEPAAVAAAGPLRPLVLSMERANVAADEVQEYLRRFYLPPPNVPAVFGAAAARAIALKDVLRGLSPPSIYDPAISIYMIEFGAQLVAHDLRHHPHTPAAYYFSSTDYMQHTYAPDHPTAHAFYQRLDAALGTLHALGRGTGGSPADSFVSVALTADHGMNDKVDHRNSPNIVFLTPLLTDAGFVGAAAARVILPITDPYVRHHSGLGSYATVYLAKGHSEAELRKAMQCIRETPGVYTVLSRAEAARAFELAADRIGDIVVVADTHTVLGLSRADHDLSHLDGTLRSHGGLSEATVPLFVSQPLTAPYAQRLNSGRARNYHLFDFLCNGIAANQPAPQPTAEAHA